MYNEYHDYSLVATAKCFVWCIEMAKLWPHEMYR